MPNEFKINLVEELEFFLGFQVKELKDVIFLSQDKYTKELIKKFGLDNAKSIVLQ